MIDAVDYYRMSSDDQSVSIERQEREVRAYAAQHGYRIIRSYKDEGKSGSKDQEKRTDFQRLLLDAAKGDFKAVLCYNASRFARLDSIDGAFAKQILRENGVCLVSVCEGKIDWNTVEGRMFDFMLSEQNHAYSRTLSKDSVSGRLRAVEAGCWPYGCIPYGYDRLYTCGSQQHRVKRSESFRKPRGWKLYLVVNEEEAAIVRRIFHLYVERAVSMRQIALQLNTEGIPAPDNLPHAQKLGWTNITVGGILRHKAYLGIAELGHRKPTAKKAFTRIPPTAKRDCCPAIVDEEIWLAAQHILDRNQERKRRQQSSRAGVLSGFLVCGHCGYALRKEQRGDGPIHYACDSPARRPHLGCHQWRVRQDDLLPRIVDKLVHVVDAEVLAALDSRPREGDVIDRRQILSKHVEGLRNKVTTATRRCLLEEDDDLAAGFRSELQALKRELQEAENTLRMMETMDQTGGVTSFAEWWQEKKEGLLFAVVGKYTYEDLGITRIDVAGSAVEPAPDYVEIDGKVWKVDHEPEFLGPLPPNEISGQGGFDKDGFRALLNRLGVTAKVKWKTAKGKGNRKFDVDFAELQIDLTWPGEETSAKHADEERNGTFSQKAFSIKREVILEIA